MHLLVKIVLYLSKCTEKQRLKSNFRVFFSCWKFAVRMLRNKTSAVTVPPMITKILMFSAIDCEFFFNRHFRPNIQTREQKKISPIFILFPKQFQSNAAQTDIDYENKGPTVIDTQSTIFIFKPTYQYLNQRVDTKTNISTLKPTYRY